MTHRNFTPRCRIFVGRGVLQRKEHDDDGVFICNMLYILLFYSRRRRRLRLRRLARNLSKPSHKKQRTFTSLHGAAAAINTSYAETITIINAYTQ